MMSERRLVIVYGSETGTSQDVAERLARHAKRRHFNTCVMALDQYDVGCMLTEGVMVFVVSTTGQGDPPDNMKVFWRFIMRRNLPTNSLESLQFAVLALGDSSYHKFNFIGKKLQKRLLQLGGQAVMEVGLADDQHDLGADAVVDPWSVALWERLMKRYPLPPGVELIPSHVRPSPKFHIELVDPPTGDPPVVAVSDPPGSDPPCETRPFSATLLSNDRVTSADHWQDVRLIKLDITGSNITYDPGDVAMIQPQNHPDTVRDFFSLIQMNPEQHCTLVQADPGFCLPSTLPPVFTLDFLVRNYLDINSIPRRSFFELLAYFSQSELEREKLEEFCTAEGQEELFKYCNRPRRTILEVLVDFPQATPHIPLDYLLDLIPSLKPRAFSIASSHKAFGDELQLLMAVVSYKTKLLKPRQGVCSTWLAGLDCHKDTPLIPMWVKKGTIHFPTSPDVPVIMVGPGTGVAPFRSFISHRICDSIPGNMLYFGCRNLAKDYFFQSEWEKHVAAGLLFIYTAFSRDQDAKVYVQDRMEENAAELWRLLDEQGAWFMLAGNAKRMPDDVRAILERVIQRQGGMNEEGAKRYILTLEKTHRYQAETWS